MKEVYLNNKGIPLEDYLDNVDNLVGLINKRIFYILKANMDSNIYKFGISTGANESAIKRLYDYVYTYGYNSDNKTRSMKQKPIHGIKLYGLWTVNYNSNVESKNSAVSRKERYIKGELRENIALVGRGSERTSVSLNKLIDLVKNNKFSEDIVTDVSKRRTKRVEAIKADGFYKGLDED